MNIAYRITAVREREQYAEALRRQIGEPESSILWDEKHLGSVWNKNKALRDLQDSEYSHILLLDDDAEAVNNFRQIVNIAVRTFPDAIWTFYTNTHHLRDRPSDTPYLELFNKNIRGICLVMPRYMIRGFLDFYDTRIAPFYPKYNHDDTAKKMYALLNNIKVMTTIPCLVRAIPIKSTMPTHHNITQNTDCWQGKDIDVKQFLTGKYEVDKIRSLFMTHLDKNEPICRECAEKFKRNKELERITR